MLCVGGYCPRKNFCSRYCLHPQPRERMYDDITDLYVYGYGVDEKWLCGEYANWSMFERFYGN